ncbi:hypothetical protein, unlikely [Trypanosoma brucei gambiense DAL972]|uniref:Uncharacterized protein n=1 Tax=Trypanosoma brucei gambiense (strain MHOM/CI/86/DAL972) TaxID=679716 RepID=C9ZJZ3_TRYB9|nr:hypothetical protein, unlikely [Trypanosoma brucei gambiense DAL972]CBH09757.1 hypothetical protein, unlikely [Trypanosoma brucei gambiense DAL972]|eukprot:XP_011772050.1 hypothetical protein, unlikely [Trypanosoma brucei gambiense DAL972]
MVNVRPFTLKFLLFTISCFKSPHTPSDYHYQQDKESELTHALKPSFSHLTRIIVSAAVREEGIYGKRNKLAEAKGVKETCVKCSILSTEFIPQQVLPLPSILPRFASSNLFLLPFHRDDPGYSLSFRFPSYPLSILLVLQSLI